MYQIYIHDIVMREYQNYNRYTKALTKECVIKKLDLFTNATIM
jgi:hypothetical protein